MPESTIFTLPEFRPYHERFLSRSTTFTKYRRYYDGTIYKDSRFKLAHKLYAETRSLFAFLARAVDLDVALVPGVMAPWELAEGTPQAQIDAQVTLYEWSGWDTEGDDWLEDGATLGEAMIKIVPDGNTVQMQRLKPELALLVKHLDPESQQVVDLALIVDRNARDAANEKYEYAEAITPWEIRTYRNGEPHGYNGNPDRYDNPLSFVPVVRTKNDTECRPTFAKAMPQIDSVNELASYINDIIGKHAEPQWVVSGAESQELTKGDNVWFIPDSAAKISPVLAQLQIDGALAFVREIKVETKGNLPELAFDDLRVAKQIATETLEIQLMELDAKIWKMRRRYDAGLVDAHRMAAMAALVYGIGGLETLLAPHSFDYKRPVRPISKLDQIRLDEAELALEAQRQVFAGEGLSATAGVTAEIVRG